MFAKAAVALLLPTLAAAQGIYGPPPGPSTPSSSAAAAPPPVPSAPANSQGHINVNVGVTTDNVSFFYSPNNFTANVGDLVTFYFPGVIAHSVTQSTFANPCTYLAGNASNSSTVGFDSGLVTASTFTLNVTTTDPIWFHCRQVGHCGTGMVGAINPPTSGNQTFSNFLAAAMALGTNAPDEAGTTTAQTGGVGAIATAPPASDTTTPASGNTSGASQIAASAGVVALSAVVAALLA